MIPWYPLPFVPIQAPSLNPSTGGSVYITGGTGAGTGSGGPITISAGSSTGVSSGRISTKAQTVWSDGRREIAVGKKYLLRIPKDSQHLAPNWDGKKVTVVNINTQLKFNIEVQHPALQGDPLRNICACEPAWLHPLCSCTVLTLLHTGCKCGGV